MRGLRKYKVGIACLSGMATRYVLGRFALDPRCAKGDRLVTSALVNRLVVSSTCLAHPSCSPTYGGSPPFQPTCQTRHVEGENRGASKSSPGATKLIWGPGTRRRSFYGSECWEFKDAVVEATQTHLLRTRRRRRDWVTEKTIIQLVWEGSARGWCIRQFIYQALDVRLPAGACTCKAQRVHANSGVATPPLSFLYTGTTRPKMAPLVWPRWQASWGRVGQRNHFANTAS